ncbi:hypothetical protein V1264_024578 [Littorina saxatilis]|uniref:Ig-like domain-containing protein n=1 Tax=Littorina saxatilis TaxID=31220 RepID=A0AAN9AL18_9CAEN
MYSFESMAKAFCYCALLIFKFNSCTGVSLDNCGGSNEDKVAEVVRNATNNTFVCSTESQALSLEWRVLYPPNGDWGAGKCPPPQQDGVDTCSGKALFPAFIPKRTVSAHSMMTVNPTQMNNELLVTNSTLVCKVPSSNNEDRCMIDYITPAAGTCNTQFDTSTSPWSLNGTCVITQGNSTLNRYACRWYQGKDGSSEKIGISGWIEMTPNMLPTGTAACFARLDMPTADGRYDYDVRVRPGRQFITTDFIGINVIETPKAPTMTGCSAVDYIAENTTVSCTCRTVNVGQPAGRLVWYRTGVIDPITSSKYGDKSLVLSQTLGRTDHDTQFRCAVNWARDISGENVTVKVGYKPERLNCTLNSKIEVTVAENDTVYFTCEADSRPVASITVVRQGGTEVNSGQSPLTFSLTASCTDTGTYLCSASNVIGQADTSASVKLYVRCSPQSSSTDLPTLNFVSTPVSTQFDVIAFPAVGGTFSFRFFGPGGKCRCSADVPLEDIQLSANCQRQSGLDNTFACAVTVHNVSSSEAEGVYSVRVSNVEGFQDYTFEVKVNDGMDMATVTCPPNYAVAAIGLGVVLALIVIVIVVVLVIFWRRQWIVPWAYQADNSRDRTASKRESSGMDLYLEPIAEPATLDGERGPYDLLNSDDIGQRSVYSEITQQTGREGTATSDATAPYDVLNPADIGQRSVYSEISQRAGKAGVLSVSGTRRKGNK